MKLFYLPGACSLAPHISLHKAKQKFDRVEVDCRMQQTATGQDYVTINPKGTVPALQLADGRVLTEVPIILQFLADDAQDAQLLPVSGMRRLECLDWLDFIATEIQKSFSPLFWSTTLQSLIQPGKTHLKSRLNVVERHLTPALRQHSKRTEVRRSVQNAVEREGCS